MGLKKREFTGTLKAAVLNVIRQSDGMSRREILEALRRRRDLEVSVRRVGLALTRLMKQGLITQTSSRGRARFHVAEAA